jgi:hypothetical protein
LRATLRQRAALGKPLALSHSVNNGYDSEAEDRQRRDRQQYAAR